jgi:hypothetical protein
VKKVKYDEYKYYSAKQNEEQHDEINNEMMMKQENETTSHRELNKREQNR